MCDKSYKRWIQHTHFVFDYCIIFRFRLVHFLVMVLSSSPLSFLQERLNSAIAEGSFRSKQYTKTKNWSQAATIKGYSLVVGSGSCNFKSSTYSKLSSMIAQPFVDPLLFSSIKRTYGEDSLLSVVKNMKPNSLGKYLSPALRMICHVIVAMFTGQACCRCLI